MNKNNNFKPHRISRNFDYIKANFVILWKNIIEYKGNFLLIIIEHLIYFFTVIFIFHVIFTNFLEILNWTFEDYFLFFIITDLIFTVSGSFLYRYPYLNLMIKKGDFNSILLRPIPKFIGYFFSNLSYEDFFSTFVNPIIHFFILILFFKVQVFNIFLASLIWLLIFICFILYFEFLHSFEFIKIGLSFFLFKNFDQINYSLFNVYPYQFFNKFKFQNFLFILSPLFFVGSLVIPILRNYSIWNFWLQILILIFLIIFFSLGIYINWKYGLKKYEAFG